MANSVSVQVKFVRSCAKLPIYLTDGSAGMDLFAGESVVIPPSERRMVCTGIALKIPDGFEGQLRPRSGLAISFGVTVVNSPGTIDSDYIGEIKVCLINSGVSNFRVAVGDRIAQLIISPVYRAIFQIVDDLPPTVRGSGGFGHTGVK